MFILITAFENLDYELESSNIFFNILYIIYINKIATQRCVLENVLRDVLNDLDRSIIDLAI